MSHFTVMVIGKNPEAQLAPYHEYECTGIDDEYVIDVDCTDEVGDWLAEPLFVGLNKETGDADYEFHETRAKENLDGYSIKTRQEWFESRDVNVDTEVDDYFGYSKNDEGRYFRHTNPNSKWDWYQVGGRWSGFFKVKDPAAGELGQRSLLMGEISAEELTSTNADVTTKGNIDIDGMQADIRKDCNERFDHLEAAIGDLTPLSWTKVRTDIMDIQGGTIDAAREFYNNSDFKQAINAYEKAHKDVYLDGFRSDVYDDFYLHLPLNQARIRYVETAAMNVVTPYAFVKDSVWVERGEMGWWGMSSNEKDKDEWTQQFYKMFNELPDDTLITMVDCHI